MTNYRKKLIEVALPLDAINKESAREKSIRHGHPSTLHLWWARRPLAACRAVLFSSLVDDPDSDPAYRRPDGTVDEERAGLKRAELFNLIEELVKWENSNNPDVINRARAEIARCVASRKIELGELKKETIVYEGQKAEGRRQEAGANKRASPAGCGPKSPRQFGPADKTVAWDMATLNARPDAVNAFLAEHAPPVLDPFCGGGSIPLEAQRLGLRAYGSDLNPVAVLITKALIEIPPKFANMPPVNPEYQRKSKQEKAAQVWRGPAGLAADVRYYGKWIRDEAEKRIGHLYPKVKIAAEMAKDRHDLKPYVGKELTVIAWLWARTIECPNPSCRARTPLVRSFWLATKKGKEAYANPVIDSEGRDLHFEVRTEGEPPKHTTDRLGARCLFCDTFVKKPLLRDIAMASGIKETPMVIVAEGHKERVYLPFSVSESNQVIRPEVPFLEQPITNDRRWFSPPLYGLPNFSNLFTARQLLLLTTVTDLVSEASKRILTAARDAAARENPPAAFGNGMNGPEAYADAVATYLGLAASKLADGNSTICSWMPGIKYEVVRTTFSRQALPMTWDYAESNPFAGSSGDYTEQVARTARAIETGVPQGHTVVGSVVQIDATAIPTTAALVSTDPPYYDNMGYADLSDFFYPWLRRSLARVYPSLFSTVLTPKTQELIAASHRFDGNREKAQQFFEDGLAKALARFRQVNPSDYPLCVFYAFKQSEADDEGSEDDGPYAETASTGWETMLEGVVRAGFSVTGTWPVRTERGSRSISIGTNALASSIVLVCRPRPGGASLATRREFITALRAELPGALRNLQRGNIAPVDLAQASIGPGMSVFTRYAKVIETDGSAMSVRTALGLINQALDEVLAEQEGEFDADTRWALAWFEQFGMKEGPFGVAETLSKAKNTAVNGLVEAGVVQARGGKVKLIDRSDLPEDWDPSTDRRLTIWEVTQYLIRTLDKQGESGAAALLRKVGGMGETARDLAYRLYTICERKKWADEALAYNGLVIAWPELTRLAASRPKEAPSREAGLFE